MVEHRRLVDLGQRRTHALLGHLVQRGPPAQRRPPESVRLRRALGYSAGADLCSRPAARNHNSGSSDRPWRAQAVPSSAKLRVAHQGETWISRMRRLCPPGRFLRAPGTAPWSLIRPAHHLQGFSASAIPRVSIELLFGRGSTPRRSQLQLPTSRQKEVEKLIAWVRRTSRARARTRGLVPHVSKTR